MIFEDTQKGPGKKLDVYKVGLNFLTHLFSHRSIRIDDTFPLGTYIYLQLHSPNP